jgi:hypothetical protein
MHKVESVKNPTGWPGWKATGDDGAPVKVAGWSGSGAGDPTAWGDAAAWGEGDAAGVGDAGCCRTFRKSNRFISMLATPSRR